MKFDNRSVNINSIEENNVEQCVVKLLVFESKKYYNYSV